MPPEEASSSSEGGYSHQRRLCQAPASFQKLLLCGIHFSLQNPCLLKKKLRLTVSLGEPRGAMMHLSLQSCLMQAIPGPLLSESFTYVFPGTHFGLSYLTEPWLLLGCLSHHKQSNQVSRRAIQTPQALNRLLARCGISPSQSGRGFVGRQSQG